MSVSDSGDKRPKIVPPVVVEDTLAPGEKEIVLVPLDEIFGNQTHIRKLDSKRDWFTGHFYKCLPLVFGNQHGFVVQSTCSFVIRWNGSDDSDGVAIHMIEPDANPRQTILLSHFGHGILTVQPRFIFRTAPGVNLMVKEPPNYPIDGLAWMNAVVETDNLRRDFTFNIKITRPHMDIFIAKGTPLGCIVPYPRFYLDEFQLRELTDDQELYKARVTCEYFAEDRARYGALGQDYRYMEGVDIFGCPFKEHQKSLDSGEWWKRKLEQGENRDQ